MIEDIQTESVGELSANPSKPKFLFNPYHSTSQPTSSLSLPPENKECRICLQATNSEDNELVNLCKCTGSVKYIHDQCFKLWVDRQMKQKSRKEQQKMLSEGVECEICKDMIGLRFQTRYVCNCSSFCDKIKSNPIGFTIFAIVFLIVLACIIYLAYNSARLNLDFANDIITGIIVICGFAVLTLAELFMLYYFLSDYIIGKQLVLQSYMKKALPVRRNMRIIPMDI